MNIQSIRKFDYNQLKNFDDERNVLNYSELTFFLDFCLRMTKEMGFEKNTFSVIP